MNIQDSSIEDKKILKFNIFNKERMKISVHTHQGIRLSSRLVYGSKSSVSNIVQIKEIIHSLLLKAKRERLMIKEIEIIHNHKTHKVGKNSFRIGELSDSDIFIATTVKEFFNIPVMMKIVSKLNYSFVQSF
jgi:hypothetical protein